MGQSESQSAPSSGGAFPARRGAVFCPGVLLPSRHSPQRPCHLMRGDTEESIDEKVQKALECPCVADLKKGPCGGAFIDAFSCFLRSTEEEKGSDCVNPFIALQDCIKANPEAFSKEVLEEEENDDEAENSNLKVRAPAWSRESKSKA